MMVGSLLGKKEAINNSSIYKSGTVTIAGKDSLDIPIGTLKSILKQAQIEME